MSDGRSDNDVVFVDTHARTSDLQGHTRSPRLRTHVAMSKPRQGTAGIDKGRLFEKVISHHVVTKREVPTSGKILLPKKASFVVAKVFRTASEQTGTFEARHAKK